MLDSVLDLVDHQSGSALGKKKKKKRRPPTCKGSVLDVFQQKENGLSFVSSLLDVMLVKKNIRNRLKHCEILSVTVKHCAFDRLMVFKQF